MARTVKHQEHARKRNDILDSVQRLVFSKGYERMTIQDILSELNISGGAFYHYFDSKSAVLDAFVERIREETEKPLIPIIDDPHLTAIEKLQGFFDTLDRLRSTHIAEVINLARVWYIDENALVRQKVEEAIVRQRAPLLSAIVRQGVQEGIFTTTYPGLAGEVILSLLQGMGNTHARLLFSLERDQDEQIAIESVVAVHAAYLEAIERMLGAPPHSLYRIDAAIVQAFADVLKEHAQDNEVSTIGG